MIHFNCSIEEFDFVPLSKQVRYLDEVWESIWKHLDAEGLELVTPCRFIYKFEGQEPEWTPGDNPADSIEKVPDSAQG